MGASLWWLSKEPSSSIVPSGVKKGNACGKADMMGKYHCKNRYTHHKTYRAPFCNFAKISHAIEKGPEIKQMYYILINIAHWKV